MSSQGSLSVRFVTWALNGISSRKYHLVSSFSLLIFWVTLGALDGLVFKTASADPTELKTWFGLFNQYVPTDGTQTWSKDFLGHWLVVFSIVAAIILTTSRERLMRISTGLKEQYLNLLFRYYMKAFIFLSLLFVSVTLFNIIAVTQKTSYEMWSVQISGALIPSLVAIAYYILVILPLSLTSVSYFILLRTCVNNYNLLDTFNYKSRDNAFGLKRLGGSITWSTFIFVVTLIPVYIIQQYTKPDDGITVNNVIATIFLGLIIFYTVIDPILKLYSKLDDEKKEQEKSIRQKIMTIEDQIAKRGVSENLKFQLDSSKEEEEAILKLKVIPLNTVGFVTGGLTFLGLIVRIILDLTKIIG